MGSPLPDGRISFGGELTTWRIDSEGIFADRTLVSSIIGASLVIADSRRATRWRAAPRYYCAWRWRSFKAKAQGLPGLFNFTST